VQNVTTNRHVELRERARQLVEQARREAARRSVPQIPSQVGVNNIVVLYLLHIIFECYKNY